MVLHVMIVRVEAEHQHRLEQLVEHLELTVAHRTTIGTALGIDNHVLPDGPPTAHQADRPTRG
jgi:hypothetical protein